MKSAGEPHAARGLENTASCIALDFNAETIGEYGLKLPSLRQLLLRL